MITTAHPSTQRSAPELVQSLAEGAHHTINHLAEQAAPHAERLQEQWSSAGDMLGEGADELREMSDAWLDALRTSVREHPLACVGVALAVGVLVARLTR
ncbi:DUF883 family protein [Hydrogenophaga pseudoflava]|uniref:DUF883 family protein n=1 Tax=Hydrogenophaga pseudoflava TaxID=47421 RepID=UPI0027E53128|nr:hypothetical protein [Hydrogenophaga pseudoflava]MDQ7744363.1 hypothetical protein [Hydrogenophaga pseudoflava]